MSKHARDDDPDAPAPDALTSDSSAPAGEPPGHPTRRRILYAAALLSAAGAGSAIGVVSPFRGGNPFTTHVALPVAPPELLAAVTREQNLIAGLVAATRQDTRTALALTHHQMHISALRSALTQYRPTGTTFSSPTPTAATGSSVEQPLADAEAAAASAGATAALGCQGALAALLASISSCESAHAQLLA